MRCTRTSTRRPWHRVAPIAALLVVALAACAPAAERVVSDREDVRPFVLSPLPFDERRFVAVYDIEVQPVRFDVAVLPARERDPRRLVDLSRGIVDVVTNELIDLGRYRVVERQRLDRILQEQDLGQTGRFDDRTVAEIGRLLNAELILTGAVSEFSLDRASAGSAVFGLVGGTTITTARIGVDLRFVDVTTGEVLGVGRGLGIASDAEVTIEGLELAMQLLRAGTVRESIVAVALRNAIRNALEDASTALPPRAR